MSENYLYFLPPCLWFHSLTFLRSATVSFPPSLSFRRAQALRLKGDIAKSKEYFEALKKKYPDDKSLATELSLIATAAKANKVS